MDIALGFVSTILWFAHEEKEGAISMKVDLLSRVGLLVTSMMMLWFDHVLLLAQ